MDINSIKNQVMTQDTQRKGSSADLQGLVVEKKPSVQGSVSGNDNTGNDEGQVQGASESSIKAAVNRVNTQMKHAKTQCEFSYHEPTKRVTIKLIDSETKEVIREIPPEDTLEMVAKMWELAGILVDEKR